MTLPKSYLAVAEALEIPSCMADHCYWGDYGEHTKGFTSPSDSTNPPVVHYRERRVTRVGLYRFLKLASQTKDDLLCYPYFWERRYMRSLWAARLGRKLHVVFSAAILEEDRARLRASLVNVRPGDLSSADRKVYDRALK